VEQVFGGAAGSVPSRRASSHRRFHGLVDIHWRVATPGITRSIHQAVVAAIRPQRRERPRRSVDAATARPPLDHTIVDDVTA
jgi:hypothetical protein